MASIIVLMGPQGAGKGTQAQLLAQRLGFPIIATGEILREIAQTDTPLGHQVKGILASGQLVSDDILAEVVSHRIRQQDCGSGSILDGFPRTLPQARLLEEIGKNCGQEIVVVKIDVPRELLYQRLAGRRTCSNCGAIYNTDFKPSKQEGTCDLCGHALFTRSDDNKEAIAQRLALYDEKTRPLLDYYNESGRLQKVDGTNAPEVVASRIAETVNKQSAGRGRAGVANEEN